ncbi:MAG: hypothetical protein WBD64_00580 [Candidatus Zixiibacteriota bacterium]
MESVNQAGETDRDEPTRKFDRYVFPVIVAVIAVFLGVLVQRFILSESHELSYSISESAPIEVGSVQYFPTALTLANTGNTSLENVILSAVFTDRIVNLRCDPRLSRRGTLLPDCDPDTLSNAVELTFDLAKGETNIITIVAQGSFVKQQFVLKSNRVMGRQVRIGETREPGYPLVLAALACVAGGFLALFITGTRRALSKGMLRVYEQELRAVEQHVRVLEQETGRLKELNAQVEVVRQGVKSKMKELEEVKGELAEKEKQVQDLEEKLKGYERQGNAS